MRYAPRSTRPSSQISCTLRLSRFSRATRAIVLVFLYVTFSYSQFTSCDRNFCRWYVQVQRFLSCVVPVLQVLCRYIMISYTFPLICLKCSLARQHFVIECFLIVLNPKYLEKKKKKDCWKPLSWKLSLSKFIYFMSFAVRVCVINLRTLIFWTYIKG